MPRTSSAYRPSVQPGGGLSATTILSVREPGFIWAVPTGRHRVLVLDNFVASAKRGIVVRGGAPGSERKIARNSVFAPEPILDGTQLENTLGTLTQMPAALARWLVRPSEQGVDDGALRSHLAA